MQRRRSNRFRNGEKGFIKVMARSMAMQRNQASDAISKNSRMAAGALQARSIASESDCKSCMSQMTSPHILRSTSGPQINLKANPISQMVR
jgi:hypothetical protein